MLLVFTGPAFYLCLCEAAPVSCKKEKWNLGVCEEAPVSCRKELLEVAAVSCRREKWNVGQLEVAAVSWRKEKWNVDMPQAACWVLKVWMGVEVYLWQIVGARSSLAACVAHLSENCFHLRVL